MKNNNWGFIFEKRRRKREWERERERKQIFTIKIESDSTHFYQNNYY